MIPLLAALLSLALFEGCSGLTKIDPTHLGRDAWQRPEDVVRALELRPGDRVADLGAGGGYFVPYLAEAVGSSGRVYAVEVESALTDSLAQRFAEDESVEAVLGGYADPHLPDASIDVVLIVNTYHHIEARPPYFERLRADLRPGARVAVIDPDEELGGVLALFLDEGHTSRAEAVIAEMRAAGYRHVASHDFLATQIFEVFAPDRDAR